jgi:toluene monooxygenase system protein E
VDGGARVTSQRTYWHLEGQGRMPQQYDIVTSRLLYHRELGFAVATPGAAWLQRFGAQSPLRGGLQAFRDPRATTYARYVELQSERETFVEQLLQSAEGSGYDASLSPEWVDVLEAVLPVLRYPCHALHMAIAYVAHLAPEGRVVVAGAFQAGDELRRVQHLAYRMRQLQELRAGFGKSAQAHWQQHPDWQPLRQLLEQLLVTYDFGEAFVALQLVVKPALDELFMMQFAQLARERGDRLWGDLSYSLARDCRWQRDWSQALAHVALAEHAENEALLSQWITSWAQRVERALPPLCNLWVIAPERASAYVAEVMAQCRQRWQSLGLRGGAASSRGAAGAS